MKDARKVSEMIVELGADYFDRNGLVRVWDVADAILKAAGHAKTVRPFQSRWHPVPDPFDNQKRWPVLAERAVWKKITAAVAGRMLKPLDPETTDILKIEEAAGGVVPFSELVEWGRVIGIYEFQKALESSGSAVTVGAGETAQKKGKIGRPSDLERKQKVVLAIVKAFEEVMGKFEMNKLPPTKADFLDACQRLEKQFTEKAFIFEAKADTIAGWLRHSHYRFKPGTPTRGKPYTSQLPAIIKKNPTGFFSEVS